jgi:hypothetical protein
MNSISREAPPMRARTSSLLTLAVVLCLPHTVQAVITLSFGNHLLFPNGTVEVPILISTDSNEEINAVDLYLQVEDGMSNAVDGPYAIDIEFLDHPTLTDPVFSAVSSSVAAYGDPWEVENGTSTGLKPAYAVFANATSGPSADVPASGVLAYVTFQMNAVAAGTYHVSFTSDDLGPTLMAKTTGPLELGVDFFLVDGSFTSIPEPASGLLGAIGAAGAALALALSRRARRMRSAGGAC